MGWAPGLVWFPSKHRWTPKKIKNRLLTKWLPQVNFQAPNPNVLKNSLFGNMSYLYKSNFPQGTPQFFSQSPKFGKIPESLISPFLVGWLSGVLPVLHTSMVEPKKIREETLVPGHGQDFNTLFCTAWNEPKIALWNDWPRVHFVKKVGSYKMIRPAKKHAFYKMAWLTRKMSLQNASFC